MNSTERMIYNNSSDIFNLKPPKTIYNFQKENITKKQIIRIEKKNKKCRTRKKINSFKI